MKILIETSWLEYGDADDILKYAEDNNIDLVKMLNIDLYQMPSYEFISYAFFCNTNVVQKHLRNLNLQSFIPDTYDKKFKKFYNREIKVCEYKSLNTCEWPVFIKPTGNNKDFDGIIAKDMKSLHDHFKVCEYNPQNNDTYYVSNVVKMSSHHRILIGKNQIYGFAAEDSKSEKMEPPTEFLNELILASNSEFYTIDVCLISNTWSIIEINPPFSIDDWGINIDKYMVFCMDFCKHIQQYITRQ